MHFVRSSLTIYVFVGLVGILSDRRRTWVGICNAARISITQLENTLNNFAELANSTNENVSLDSASTSDRLHISHGQTKDLDASFEVHSSELLRDGVKAAPQEEITRHVALLGNSRTTSNASRENQTANSDKAYLQSSVFLQSIFEFVGSEAGHLASIVSGVGRFSFGFALGACTVVLILGFCCQHVILHMTSSPEEKCRQQVLHKGRVIYEWTQTSSEIIFCTSVPKDIQQKNVEVKILPKRLQIAAFGKTPFMKGELFGYVDARRSVWNMSWQGKLEIRMRKQNEHMQWPCVISAHNEINGYVSEKGSFSSLHD